MDYRLAVLQAQGVQDCPCHQLGLRHDSETLGPLEPLDRSTHGRRRIGVLESCRISVRATPNARRDEVVGWVGEELKAKVRALALDGRANEALCEFISEQLELPRGAVALVRGGKSRSKLIEIRGLSAGAVRERLSGPR